MSTETITLYRPTGPTELELVAQTGYKRWPPRLPEQPIFYPVTNEEYARKIALEWNVPESGAGFVTRFQVDKTFMERYAVHHVGGQIHTEWWIPAEDLESLNDHIVGLIEVIGAYGAIPPETSNNPVA
ncbi:MAG: hypothetical protein KDC71_21615 [Acidobacteria bacterium]|nr:hypothetical protein [Acidobacteriota bacterium]